MFAPVMTKGLFEIKIKANDEILRELEKAKLVEKTDDGFFLRKAGAWKKRLHKILEENGWDYYPTIENGYITWHILDENERLEEFLKELDDFIEQIRDILDFEVEVEVEADTR